MPKSVLAAGLVLLGLGLGGALAVVTPQPTESQSIEWLDNPRSIGRFQLQSDADRFDNQAFIGRWTIVLFGFLHCPDVCPTSLSELSALADELPSTVSRLPVEFLFVSVDPGRDTAQAVHQYAKAFNPTIRGVTGASDQLARFAQDLGTAFEVDADGADYRVRHGLTFSIIDPSGRFRARFRPGFDQSQLIQNLLAKLTEARS